MYRVEEEPDGRGLLGQIGATVHAFLGFFHVRAQLLAVEAREGFHSFKVYATLLSLGILLVLLGYVGGMAAGVSLLSRKMELPWESILLWIALPHLLLGVALVWVARERLFQPMFDSTLDELDKDQRWLRSNLPSNGAKRS